MNQRKHVTRFRVRPRRARAAYLVVIGLVLGFRPVYTGKRLGPLAFDPTGCSCGSALLPDDTAAHADDAHGRVWSGDVRPCGRGSWLPRRQTDSASRIDNGADDGSNSYRGGLSRRLWLHITPDDAGDQMKTISIGSVVRLPGFYRPVMRTTGATSAGGVMVCPQRGRCGCADARRGSRSSISTLPKP